MSRLSWIRTMLVVPAALTAFAAGPARGFDLPGVPPPSAPSLPRLPALAPLPPLPPLPPAPPRPPVPGLPDPSGVERQVTHLREQAEAAHRHFNNLMQRYHVV